MKSSEINVTEICSVVIYGTDPERLHYDYTTHINNRVEAYHNELIFILKGSAKVHFVGIEGYDRDGHLRILPAGIYPKGTKYFVDKQAKTSDDSCIDIFFHTDKPIASGMVILNFEHDKTMRTLFEQIHQVWHAKHTGYYYKSMTLLYEILEKLEIAQTSYLPQKKFEQIKPALEYIDENFSSGTIDCAYLSSLCGISYSYFKRLFILRFGIPPAKYITEKRISYACDLLVTKRYTVSEAARMSGFNNGHYFCKVFKENLGVTPSEYAYRPQLP